MTADIISAHCPDTVITDGSIWSIGEHHFNTTVRMEQVICSDELCTMVGNTPDYSTKGLVFVSVDGINFQTFHQNQISPNTYMNSVNYEKIKGVGTFIIGTHVTNKPFISACFQTPSEHLLYDCLSTSNSSNYSYGNGTATNGDIIVTLGFDTDPSSAVITSTYLYYGHMSDVGTSGLIKIIMSSLINGFDIFCNK
jgi:hypothetical protein